MTKIEIFGNFDQMRGLQIVFFFFFFTEIQIFKNFERGQDFSKFRKKNPDFPKILTKIEIFQKFYLKARFLKIVW